MKKWIKEKFSMDDPVNDYFHARAVLRRLERAEKRRELEEWEVRLRDKVNRQIKELEPIWKERFENVQ